VAGRLGVLILLVMLTAGCDAGDKRAALPPVNASPQRVVAAYIAALNAHDLRTARALLTPAHERDVESEADSWFTNLRSITHLHLHRPATDTIDARSMHYRHGVVVGAEFVLDQHEVESMEDGPNAWSFTLVRNSPGQRWLIGSEGLG